MTSTAGLRRRAAFALGATGILAAALALAYQWPGVTLSPDGWAYWEGSVSLLRGGGLRYFGGQPITLWPPLFPLYLSLWQASLGTIAGALAIAQAVALGGAAALWGRLALPEEGVDLPALAALPALASLIALFQRELASESLALLLAGAGLGIAAEVFRLPRRGKWVALALLLAALLLTRNAALALLPGALAVAVMTEAGERRRVLLRALAAGTVAVGIWVVVRIVFGQIGSHPLVLPAPERFLAVARGVVERLVALAGPHRMKLGALLLAAQLALALAVAARRDRDREAAEAVRLIAFGALVFVATVLLVPIASPLEDRFGRFSFVLVPLLALVPAKVVRSASSRPLRALAGLLLVVTAAVGVGRAVYWIGHAGRGAAPEGIGWSVCIDPRGAAAGCVAPPDFDWIDRRGSAAVEKTR